MAITKFKNCEKVKGFLYEKKKERCILKAVDTIGNYSKYLLA